MLGAMLTALGKDTMARGGSTGTDSTSLEGSETGLAMSIAVKGTQTSAKVTHLLSMIAMASFTSRRLSGILLCAYLDTQNQDHHKVLSAGCYSQWMTPPQLQCDFRDHTDAIPRQKSQHVHHRALARCQVTRHAQPLAKSPQSASRIISNAK